MLTRILWIILGLSLVMAALLGNFGAVIGSIIDPSDMVLGNKQQPQGNQSGIPGNQVPGAPGQTNQQKCQAAGGTWYGSNQTEGKCVMPTSA